MAVMLIANWRIVEILSHFKKFLTKALKLA
jgi:hypothetical protein